jgi:hypothetical protein
MHGEPPDGGPEAAPFPNQTCWGVCWGTTPDLPVPGRTEPDALNTQPQLRGPFQD